MTESSSGCLLVAVQCIATGARQWDALCSQRVNRLSTFLGLFIPSDRAYITIQVDSMSHLPFLIPFKCSGKPTCR